MWLVPPVTAYAPSTAATRSSSVAPGTAAAASASAEASVSIAACRIQVSSSALLRTRIPTYSSSSSTTIARARGANRVREGSDQADPAGRPPAVQCREQAVGGSLFDACDLAIARHPDGVGDVVGEPDEGASRTCRT